MRTFLRGATFALLAAAALDAAAAPCPTTTLTPTGATANGTVGVAYSQPFTASNINALPFTFSVTSGLPAGSGLAFAPTGPGSANLAGSPTQVGNYLVTATATDSGGCSGGRIFALSVAQGTQTISFTSTAPATAAVGGAPYAVAATASSGLPVSLAVAPASASVCTLTGGNVSFQSTGTCTINADQAGNANYAAAPQVQQSFTVGPGSQTISFSSTAPAAAVFNGPAYTVAATASSGLAVAYTIDASAATVCAISGTTVSFIGAGTCVVNANQAGNANYSPAPQVQQSFTVARASQTVSFTSTAPAGAVFNGPTYTVTATATSGLPVALTIAPAAAGICSISGATVSFTGTGTCIVNADQAGDANYNAATQVQQSFAVASTSQTITFTSTAPAAAVFDGPTYTVAATASSGLTVTYAIDASAATVCSISGTTVSFIGTGTCVVNANQAGNANYAAAPQVQQGFTVAQATQTVSFTSTAPAVAVFNGPTYDVTATATSGLPVALTIAPAAAGICSISGSTVSFIGVGTCVVNANQGGNANYAAAAQVQQSFAVAQATQTISFTSTAPAVAVFNGPTYSVTATATSGLTVALTIAPASAGTCSISGTTVSFIGTGTCVVNANQAGNANYNAAPQVQQSFTVSPASQTISFTSAAPAAAVFNGPTYSVTATATSGLTVALTIAPASAGTCSISGTTVSFIGTGTCVVNANQAGNANYNAAPQVQQSFTVNPASQTVSFTSTAPAAAVFSGPTYEATATATSGLAVAFTIDASAAAVCSISGTTVSFIGAGTCVVNANQAGNANYSPAPQVQQSFAVAQAAQTVSFTSTAPTTASVGGVTYTVAATATSGLPVAFTIDASAAAICTISGTTVSFTAAGTCVVNANQAGDANYSAAPQVQQSFAVSNCISLALGQVTTMSMPGGASVCVSGSTIDTEYTYLPINFSTTSDTTLSVTATGIQAVTGPPSPRPDAGGIDLAPLRDALANDDHGVAAHGIASAPPFADRPARASDLLPLQPDGTGTTPLVVGQLIDLNTAVGGCSVTPDIRKARVEAVTTPQTPGQPLLFAVQEVIEEPAGSGNWVPPVVGGFITQDFQAIIDSFAQLPPGNTVSGQGTLGGQLRTGGLNIARTNLGEMSDVDANGGVIVFFTRKINEQSPPATAPIPAIFQPRDLFSSASCPGSNEAEMLYFAVPDPTGVVNSNVRTLSFVYGNAGPTLTHHYAHLSQASRRLYFNGAAPLEQIWLDEAIAYEMQELGFFSASVGLAPRQNVQLSNLTTGPNASIRVADFNTYQNPMFGGYRNWLLQLNGSNGNRRVGPLRTTALTTSTTPNAHEAQALNFAGAQMFLRYMLDRRNTGDAALLNALVNSNAVGTANLQAVFGADPTQWARDFLVAAYTDDAGIGVGSDYTLPSWNYRSVFGGLGGFPLSVNPLTDSTALVALYGPGGGTRYARFGIIANGQATVNLTEGGGPPNANVVMAIVRTK